MSDKRVNVNQSETAGNTALIMAALRGQSKVVEQLLKDQRVEVIQRNNFGQSALIIAASMKHIDVVQLFLNDKRVKVNSTTMNLSSAFPLKKLTARQGHQGPLLRLQGPRPPFLAQEGWQRRWRTEEVFNVASRKRKRRRKYAGARWKYSLYLKPINFENIFATLFKTKPCVS